MYITLPTLQFHPGCTLHAYPLSCKSNRCFKKHARKMWYHAIKPVTKNGDIKWHQSSRVKDGLTSKLVMAYKIGTGRFSIWLSFKKSTLFKPSYMVLYRNSWINLNCLRILIYSIINNNMTSSVKYLSAAKLLLPCGTSSQSPKPDSKLVDLSWVWGWNPCFSGQ